MKKKSLTPSLGHSQNKEVGQRVYSSRSLHGQVVHELGRRIVSGTIPEGAVLPIETDLGAEFDVSRTALREGIKVLTAKGLLVSRTRTGTRVRPRGDWNMLDPDVLAWRLETHHDEDFAQDLYDFRMSVEPMVASLAAVRATDAEILEMEEAVAGMIEAKDDFQAFMEPDLRFHRLLLTACRNELLSSLAALIETALTFSFAGSTLKLDMDMAGVHSNVLQAIQNRDAEGANAAMVKLLSVSRDLNKAVLADIKSKIETK